jgi:LysM repeat protein
MADRGWGQDGPVRRDGWGRPVGPYPPRRTAPAPRGRDLSNPGGEWEGLPGGDPDDPVYSGPRYPREMVGYGARRDATDPRSRNGVRMAVPTKRWELGDGLPTVPTVLLAGAAVVLAFVVGHATGGGGSGTSVAATTPTTTGVTVTTSTAPSTHTVAVGESLSSIATSFGLTTQDLASFNNITNINHVFTGEVLKIPTPTTLPAATPTTKKR